MSDERLTCTKCGRTYKTFLTFLRHKCAVQIRDEIEAALENEDMDTVMRLARWADGEEEEAQR